ncbi:hypothetical protein FACS1894204_01900 [Synergistales bacterium]|nr:hypothetical protein FACS1894204_01900 [Synergistales bacterium]
MKLSEALEVLLKAEDEAAEAKTLAEREAKAIIQKAHDEYARAEDSSLSEARREAAKQMEDARLVAEKESQRIAALADVSTSRMLTQFERKEPGLIAHFADALAARYAARDNGGA